MKVKMHVKSWVVFSGNIYMLQFQTTMFFMTYHMNMMKTGCRLVLIVAHVTVSNNHVFL